MPRRLIAIVLLGTALVPLNDVVAQSALPPFSDVRPSSPAYDAIEYVKATGMIQSGKQFNPFANLTRAEAVKILLSGGQVTDEELKSPRITPFNDVEKNAWYQPYVGLAVEKKLIEKPGKDGMFRPTAAITKAEFLKMALTSRRMDPSTAFSDVTEPLAFDLDSSHPLYNVVRLGIASSVATANKSGLLEPNAELTREQMALVVYGLDMYRAGKRTPTLLATTEAQILAALRLLEAQDVRSAKMAAARGRLAAMGALGAQPNDPMVKSGIKTTESGQALALAQEARTAGNHDTVIAFAKKAWSLGEHAKQFTPSMKVLPQRMQNLAKVLADEARAEKAKMVPGVDLRP